VVRIESYKVCNIHLPRQLHYHVDFPVIRKPESLKALDAKQLQVDRLIQAGSMQRNGAEA
jgi:hypothetical protein